MVLMNMYGKIPETIISKKLGIGICNPAPDWVEGLQDDFEEELLIHEHEISSFKKSGYDTAWASDRYNLEKIVFQLGWQEEGKTSMQIIAEHLIEIQVLDFDNSLLQMKNDHLDSPTCEPQYPRKFLNLCCKIQSSQSAQTVIPNQIPFSTYNSDDFQQKPLILNFLGAMLHPHPNYPISIPDYTAGGIKSLEYIGSLIDNFLVTDKDFWLFDYIVNAVFRRHHLSPANVEPIFTRTVTPPALCSIDAQGSGLYTQLWCKMLHLALQRLPGNLTIQLLGAAL